MTGAAPGNSPRVPAPLLQLRGVEAGYASGGPGGGAHRVSRPIGLEVNSGEFICLIGPNGSGKSTLLRTLAGAQPALAGSVFVAGDDVGDIPRLELARRVAVVLTDPIDAWALTGHELVSLGRLPYLGWTGRLRARDQEAVDRALHRANATSLAPRPIRELSDGERQRVLLARALAQDASLLLLDEITAFLDLPHRLEVMRFLGELARDGTRSVILSTHDLELALRTADRIWLLPGDGTLVDGAPEDLAIAGDIDRSFAQFGVRFDLDTGHFDWQVERRGRVALLGEGHGALWASRALLRCGYQVVRPPDPAPMRIEVICGSSGHRWRLEVEDRAGTEEYDSLGGLARRLRRPDLPAGR